MDRTDVERERRAVFFLARLERLCHLEERFVSPPDVVVDPRRLVSKAIFSTYYDCVVLGRKVAADRLLATRRATAPDVVGTPPAEAEPAR
jgi:hypothetical protein